MLMKLSKILITEYNEQYRNLQQRIIRGTSNNKWFSNEPRSSKMEKMKSYLRAVIQNSNELWRNYKSSRYKNKAKIQNEKNGYDI